jgi:DNA-binding NtrC family response regulator
MIYGETGTGKEKAARAIHDLSLRKDREFVAINAASLSDELFESEIFGHVRGSFTGAMADRPGLVERAKGGTLFVDEVADLSPRSQVRLLRFVQEGTYRRVGENHERRADVRIVVASNQKLEDLVAAGRFREDLLHRLRGVSLVIPPLRDRGRDVVHLARHLVAEASSRLARLSRESEANLLAHSWPGNVRELEQEMRRAVVMSESRVIEWRGPEATAVRQDVGEKAGTQIMMPLHEAVGGFERKLLQSVLSRGIERAEAARLLGISRQALHQKIVRYGL